MSKGTDLIAELARAADQREFEAGSGRSDDQPTRDFDRALEELTEYVKLLEKVVS